MENVSLEFQGTGDLGLLIVLLSCVAAVLAAAGVWKLAHRKWRDGSICLAAALGPAGILAALLVDAVVRHRRGDRRAARSSLLGAVVVAAGAAVGAAFVAASGFNAAAFWMVVLGLEVAVAVGVFYSVEYAHLGARRLTVLMALRCAAVLTLLLILFKPAVSVLPSNKPPLPILVDRSGSMATEDEPNLPGRYTLALQMLSLQQDRIRKHFQPVWYHFAAGPKRAESLEALRELTPAGAGTDTTNIASAIRTATADHDRSALPGVLVLSDGNQTAADSVAEACAEAGVPIYTVGLGASDEPLVKQKNIQLVSADAPLEAVRHNVATITVRVKLTGISNAEIHLLEEGSDRPVNTRKLSTTKNSETLTVELKWTAGDPPPGLSPEGDKTGIRKLRLRIPRNPAEAVGEDNETELHVLVTDPQIRVLYVEGSIRPEYKFLRRFLDTDRNIQYMGLVRFHGESFSAQGRIGGKQLDRLPASDEDFAMLDVLILGDLDRSMWTDEQAERIRKFVNDGGALLMLGGSNTLGPGGYGGTPVELALPVTLGPRSQPEETTKFLPQLTAEDETDAVFEGITGYFAGPGERERELELTELPGLFGCVTVVGAKPAASVLAVHPTRTNDAGPLIVLAVQKYGAGRSAVFTADTTWRWYMKFRSLGIDNPYERFWGQFVRWLANVETKSRDAGSSVMMRLDRSYVRAGETINVLARVQDEKGRPPVLATVTCTVTPDDDGDKIESHPLIGGRGPGLFDLNYQPRRAGKYRLKCVAVDAAGKTLGADELTLTVAARSLETEQLARNADLLRATAERSQGAYADVTALPELIDRIIERQKGRIGPQPQRRNYRLYNFTLLFLAFAGLLTGEWVLRRRWQLQ